ncbi:hypothetical protein [Methylorubrum thiocyanatum]|uniref:hypothetical protein n=1 Tax=Methylorubrum thiocyanatum TaxID=47958 RepID=UPI003F7E2AA1
MGRHEIFDTSASIPALNSIIGAHGIETGIARMPSTPEAETGLDSELIALANRHEALAAEYLAASRHAAALEGIGKPTIPEACLVRLGDQELGLAGYAHGIEDRRWYAVESADAERRYLRRRFWRFEERIATEADSVPAGDTIARRVPWPEAQARADEIVAAWDQWQADIAAAHRASGYAEAIECATRLGDEVFALEHRIRARTPRTLPGLAALAKFAQRLQAEGEDDELEGGLLARAILAVAAYSAEPEAETLPFADPHPAMMPEVMRLWREHRRTMFGWGCPSASTEAKAANAAHNALVDTCMAVAEQPAPQTPEGFAALATAIGLAFEQSVDPGSDETSRTLGALISAAVKASGAAMPADWKGAFFREEEGHGASATPASDLTGPAELVVAASALTDQIIACWREWAALPDFDETDQGKAKFERLGAERSALCAAAEALPVELGHVPAKALALAWLGYSDLWHHGVAREHYSLDGRLAIDIDTAVTGRLKTRYLEGAA